MQGRAVLMTGPDTIELAAIDVPDPGPGQVRVRATKTLISPGTELRCWAGQQPNGTPYPFVPGYALTGHVESAGPDVGFRPGDRVLMRGTKEGSLPLMWGGHTSLALRQADEVLPIPEGMSDELALTSRLGGIAFRGVRLTRPRPFDKVAVVGLGPIGQMSARLFSATGAEVVGLDLSENRAQSLREAGVEAISGPDAMDRLKERWPSGCLIGVDATGSPAVFEKVRALLSMAAWGDDPYDQRYLVVQGSYPTTFSVDYQEAFSLELAIVLPRDMQPRDQIAVLDLMRRDKIDAANLVTETLPADRALEAYRRLRDEPDSALTLALNWTE